jgi:hypothetical protein
LGEEETDYVEVLEAELNKVRLALVTIIVATQVLHVELCFWKCNQLS